MHAVTDWCSRRLWWWMKMKSLTAMVMLLAFASSASAQSWNCAVRDDVTHRCLFSRRGVLLDRVPECRGLSEHCRCE